jgi:hypothetical protein
MRDMEVWQAQFKHLMALIWERKYQMSLLNNKVEVTTYCINDENMKNCPHTHMHE